MLAFSDLAQLASVTPEVAARLGAAAISRAGTVSLGDAARRGGRDALERVPGANGIRPPRLRLARRGIRPRYRDQRDARYRDGGSQAVGAQRKRTQALVENGADEVGLVVNLKGRYLITQRERRTRAARWRSGFCRVRIPAHSHNNRPVMCSPCASPVRGSLLSSTACGTAACGEYRASPGAWIPDELRRKGVGAADDDLAVNCSMSWSITCTTFWRSCLEPRVTPPKWLKAEACGRRGSK